MYKKACIFALALVGADAFAPTPPLAPVGSSRGLALRTASQTVVMGTFIEEFKYKKIANRFTFKTFADCIEKAGMTGQCKGNTLFAPTDAAFADLGDAGLAEIMGNPATLKKMVGYHIVSGKQDGPSFRLDNGKKLMTLQGSALTVEFDGNSKGTAFVDQAKVETYDIVTDEGSFHVIDWVNMPKA